MKFDSAEWRIQRDQLLHHWMEGNQDAVNFLLDAFRIAELWDDIVDGDPVDTNTLHEGFMTCLFSLPSNPFYRRFEPQLQTMLLAGINAWLDSVELEKHPANQWASIWAYALRDFYMELVNVCAYIVGGYNHMRAISLQARQFFQAETFEEYINGRNA